MLDASDLTKRGDAKIGPAIWRSVDIRGTKYNLQVWLDGQGIASTIDGMAADMQANDVNHREQHIGQLFVNLVRRS